MAGMNLAGNIKEQRMKSVKSIKSKKKFVRIKPNFASIEEEFGGGYSIWFWEDADKKQPAHKITGPYDIEYAKDLLKFYTSPEWKFENSITPID